MATPTNPPLPGSMTVPIWYGWEVIRAVLLLAVPGAVVVGMGLNVAWPPEPTDLAISASSVAGRPIGRDELLDAYLGHLAGRLQQWEHDPAALHADLCRLSESGLPPEVANLLDAFERDATLTRARALIANGRFPTDPSGQRHPWPMV